MSEVINVDKFKIECGQYLYNQSVSFLRAYASMLGRRGTEKII